jgi:hypothetical protein
MLRASYGWQASELTLRMVSSVARSAKEDQRVDRSGPPRGPEARQQHDHGQRHAHADERWPVERCDRVEHLVDEADREELACGADDGANYGEAERFGQDHAQDAGTRGAERRANAAWKLKRASNAEQLGASYRVAAQGHDERHSHDFAIAAASDAVRSRPAATSPPITSRFDGRCDVDQPRNLAKSVTNSVHGRWSRLLSGFASSQNREFGRGTVGDLLAIGRCQRVPRLAFAAVEGHPSGPTGRTAWSSIVPLRAA